MDTTAKNRPVRSRILFWTLGGLLLIGLIAALIVLRINFSPEQGCSPPMLTLGTKEYVIETIQPESDGSLKVPANQDDTAFWVEGTDTNQVFALSPTADNLALETSLKLEDKAIVRWANCNSTTYTLSTSRKGASDIATLLDQSVSGITIFIQADSSTTGFVVKGELAGETINVFNTPDMSEVQAEISLLETSTSGDKQTIRIGISILNYGKSAITLTADDVALSYENTAPVPPASAEPPLPLKIKSGSSETIYFVFPRPSSITATLKIFSVEYELEGY